MALYEFMPGRSHSQIWLRIIPVLDKGVFHCGLADFEAQIDDLVGDLLVSPAGVFFFESNDEIHDLFGNLRPTWRSSIPRPIILLCDELSIPPRDSIYREQLCTLLQHLPAEPFCLGRHPHPLPVGQSNTIALGLLVFHEDPYLFSQVVNCLVKFLVDALGQTSDDREP